MKVKVEVSMEVFAANPLFTLRHEDEGKLHGVLSKSIHELLTDERDSLISGGRCVIHSTTVNADDNSPS